MTCVCPWCGHRTNVPNSELARTFSHPRLEAHIKVCEFSPLRQRKP